MSDTSPEATPASGAEGERRPPAVSREFLTAVGEVAFLANNTQPYDRYPIWYIGARLAPPMLFDQFRMYRKGQSPVGYVSWAFVSEELDKRLRSENVSLTGQDWKSGETLWIMDFMAPFGDAEFIVDELRRQIFPRNIASARLPLPDGQLGDVQTFYGIEAPAAPTNG